MSQILDFGRSDQNCHQRSDNYITIPRKCRSQELEGALLASYNNLNSKTRVIKLEQLNFSDLNHMLKMLNGKNFATKNFEDGGWVSGMFYGQILTFGDVIDQTQKLKNHHF